MHLSVETVALTAGLNDGSPLTVAFRSEVEHGVGGFWDFVFHLCEIIHVVLCLRKREHCVLLL